MNKTRKVFINALGIICLVLVAFFFQSMCLSCESNLNKKRIEYGTNTYTNTLDSLVDEEYNNEYEMNRLTQYSDTMYIVRIKIHQTTYTIDPFEYLKNKMNDIEFEIPVDKEYYNTCKVGSKINDPKLKMGSLVMDGDFSKLKITISGKSIRKR